jgi:hypothetical protein
MYVVAGYILFSFFAFDSLSPNFERFLGVPLCPPKIKNRSKNGPNSQEVDYFSESKYEVLPLLLFIPALLLLCLFFHMSWIPGQVEIVQKPLGSTFKL